MSTDSPNWAAPLQDPEIVELGGEHGNEGVDYARFWAMSLLLRLEGQGASDYAIVFEYLQDVAHFNSSTAPTSAVLYQVKKKARGSWTRSALCSTSRRKPDLDGHAGTQTPTKKLKGRSPLGKLHVCIAKLSNIAETSGVFVSNAPYDLKAANGTALAQYSKHCLTTLHSEDATYIASKLKKELALGAAPDIGPLHVEHSRINPETMRETIRGQLDQYLQERHPTLPNISGRLQESLLHQFSQLSGAKPPLSTLTDVLNHKGFVRSGFTALIESMASIKVFASALDNAVLALKQEGWPSRKADRLRTAAARLQIRFLRHPETKETAGWNHALEAAKTNTAIESYSGAMQVIRKAIESKPHETKAVDSSFLDALSLLALIHVDQEP